MMETQQDRGARERAMNVPKIKFETENCDRCDGTGMHSYNTMHGRTCFKCKGSGKQLSRSGVAARKAYDAAIERYCTLPGSELQAGDVIWDFKTSTRKGWVKLETPEQYWTGAPTMKFKLWIPERYAQIREEIADRYEGAWLV
jgi:hypothetical protein